MKEIKKGIWAIDGNECQIESQPRMTLRDSFAEAAIKGFCSHHGVDQQSHGVWYEQIAVPQAYRIADAMIREREK